MADKADTGEGIVARLLNDRGLADQIVATGPKVNAALDETQSTLRNLNKTSAALPKMTASPNDQLKQLPRLVRQMERTLADVQLVLKDVQRTPGQLPQTVTSVNRTVEGLPALAVQAQEALRQTPRMVAGMQRSWLVRGEMDADAPGGRERRGRRRPALPGRPGPARPRQSRAGPGRRVRGRRTVGEHRVGRARCGHQPGRPAGDFDRARTGYPARLAATFGRDPASGPGRPREAGAALSGFARPGAAPNPTNAWR